MSEKYGEDQPWHLTQEPDVAPSYEELEEVIKELTAENERLRCMSDLSKLVKPLTFERLVDGAGWHPRVWAAHCPVFSKTFYAESEADIPKVQAKRAAIIIAALDPEALARRRDEA